MSKYQCETCKHRGDRNKCSILQFLLGGESIIINRLPETDDKTGNDIIKARSEKLAKQLQSATFLIPCHSHSDVINVTNYALNKTQEIKRVELCFQEELKNVKTISEDLYDSDTLKSEWRNSLRRVEGKLINKLAYEKGE